MSNILIKYFNPKNNINKMITFFSKVKKETKSEEEKNGAEHRHRRRRQIFRWRILGHRRNGTARKFVAEVGFLLVSVLLIIIRISAKIVVYFL
jgi:hypothetical protein